MSKSVVLQNAVHETQAGRGSMSAIRWKNDNDEVGNFNTFNTVSDWVDGAGPAAVPDAIPLAVGVDAGKNPKLTTLVGLDGVDGEGPDGTLYVDAAGNLIGTTQSGGADGDGTVFEIAQTKHGYANVATTLYSFTGGADGYDPRAGLIADSSGNLFGTTEYGGSGRDGTVFEIAKTKGGYASTPTTLASFTGDDGMYLLAGLTVDGAGDLFGTTAEGGADGYGAVFEIVKTKGGYANAPTTLYSFTNGADGGKPSGSLMADPAGDLFGMTYQGGADGDGTVYEIAKTKSGYADAPTTIVSFTGVDGAGPLLSSLITDAAGDLFGTTDAGGTDGDGTVFEIAKTKGGYSSAPTTLVSFTGGDGAFPINSVIMDAAGNLFGTTDFGGADGDGTEFEIAKTKHGYASAPTTLVSFTGDDGANPNAGLIANAAGNLFGAASKGGPNNDGTVFEITHSGYVPPDAPTAPAAANANHLLPMSAAFAQAMASHGAARLGSGALAIPVSRNDMPMLISRPHAAY